MHHHVQDLLRRRRELERLIRGRSPRRRIRAPLPRQAQPDAARLEYFAALRGLLLRAKRMVDARLVPRLAQVVAAATQERGEKPRLDAGPADVNRLVDGIAGDFFRSLGDTELEDLAQKFARATSDFQKQQLGRQMQAAVGVEVPIRDAKLGPLIRQFNAQNVALIKTVPRRYFAQVEQRVLSGVAAGDRWEDIAEQLEGRFGVSESSAQLIARDQVGKFYGDLNRVRQEELGIEKFKWQDAGDNRVRETHLHLNGKTFEWAEPPNEATGEPDPDNGVIPGQPIQCRCNASPDVAGVLENL